MAHFINSNDRNTKRIIDVEINDVISLGGSDSSHHTSWNQHLVVDRRVETYESTGPYLYLQLERPYMHYSGTKGIAYIGLERWTYVCDIPKAEAELCHYHIS